MIEGCPKCGVRYRIDPAWVGPEGRRLRCARCSTVFRVSGAGASTEEVAPSGSSAPQVLIADSREEDGKRMAAVVASCGLPRVLVHDGAEAMTQIGRMVPAVAILDAALPRMRGLEICEYVKRIGPSQTRIVLVGAPQHRDRRFGADVYLDRSELEVGLLPALEQLGVLPARGTAGAPPTSGAAQGATAGAPAPDFEPSGPSAHTTAPDPALHEEPDPDAAAEVAEARAYAERLARVIVSDIVLYEQDRFEAAAQQGKVLEELCDLAEEGRELFRQRVDERVVADRDYVGEELVRVARARAGR